MHDIARRNSSKRNSQRKGRGKGKSHNKPMPESSGKFDRLGGVMVRLPGIGIPRRMIANVRMMQQGYLGAGAGAANSASVYLNSYFEPFNSGAPLSSNWGINFSNGSSTTANFVPNSWFSVAYQSYRVRAAMLKVTAVCGAAGDTMDVYLVPVPTPGLATLVNREASGLPGYKSMLVSAGMRPTSIMSRVRPADVLGLTAQQYADSTTVAGAFGAVPAQLCEWALYYATGDGAVLSQQVYFTFEIEFEMEFFNPISPNT